MEVRAMEHVQCCQYQQGPTRELLGCVEVYHNGEWSALSNEICDSSTMELVQRLVCSI